MNYTDFVRSKCYINGEWISSIKNETFEVSNPVNNECIARVPNLHVEDVKMVINNANLAFDSWKNTTGEYRASLLKKLYQLQLKYRDQLAYILTLEQGKTLVKAKAELTYGASFIEWFAEEARRSYGETIPTNDLAKRIFTIKQPIGVVAAITPWNFPNAMITRKVSPALAAGCTVIVKPSEETPLSALALAVLVEQAGFPKGVFNVVTSLNADKIGKEFSLNAMVKKISFTGSTKVGKILMQQCAQKVKKISLELGGNAPFIVFEDADLDKAVEGVMVSKFRNSGQTCVCTNRIFVHEKIHNEFINMLVQRIQNLKIGDGREATTDIGPLINKKAIEFVDYLVEEAIGKGATVLVSDKGKKKGNFYPPTLLVNVTSAMEIYNNEIFGCIAAVTRFSSISEVVRKANDTPYGLASYLYTNDYQKIWRVTEALECGMVGVNTGTISTTIAPFGGVKESGIGREGSKYGIGEYQEIKYMCLGGVM